MEAHKVDEEQGRARWYVVRTRTGHEDRVLDHLKNKKACLRVFLPKTEVTEVRGGRKRKKEKPLFPGYVFVKMVFRDELWHEIKRTPGVINLISAGQKPIPVDESEIRAIMKMIESGETPQTPVPFSVGDTVHIISGPFMGAIGTVEEVNEKKGKVKVSIDILGKQIPIELEFSDVEKR
ncbi:transcription termination/antitermination factor NusG [Candidatus Poribacteria bacterium]|nr:MAG: transcription termination/antitermination factor NusG [Candidatus Poribacteria bacterium]